MVRTHRREEIRERFHQVNHQLRLAKNLDWENEWKSISERLLSVVKNLEFCQNTLKYQF
jgi:hypothetical protein